MTQLSSYSLDDFLLFSLSAYYGVFEQINTALWPVAHIASLLVVLALATALWTHAKWSAPVVYGLLAIVWAWTGWYFMVVQYAQINWMTSHVSVMFFAQALLLGAVAVSGRGLAFRQKPSGLIVLIFLLTIIAYPASTVVSERPWQAAEMFALSPDPSVGATLAVLVASRGRLLWVAWIVPLAWVVLSGLTLWLLKTPEWMLLPSFAILCLAWTFSNSRTSR